MGSPRFTLEHHLFRLTGTTDDEQIKLFVDIEVLSRTQELTAKLLEEKLLEHVADELLDRGVLQDIAKILRDQNKIEKRRIAKGRRPKKGIDGKLVFLKRKLSREPHLQEIDDLGSVSLKELGLFENIRKGEPVVRIYPPKEGEPGLSVSGEEIVAPIGDAVQVAVDDATLEREAGAVQGLSYDRVLAKVDGYLEQQGPKLILREEFVVTGDLNADFGSIAFVGTVNIKGDVLAGFHVSGEKGVTIGGNVNRTEISSQDGPIHIKGRFFGEGKGKIITPKTVRVRAIQDGVIDALQDVWVEDEARSATIRTRGSLQAPKASFVGGKYFAVMGVVIGEFGTKSNVVTTLLLGSDIEVTEQYQMLLVQIEKHEKAVELLNAHLGPYAKNSARIQLLTPKLRPKMEALLAKRDRVSSSLEGLCQKRDVCLQNANIEATMCCSIQKSFFPGAIIHAGDVVFEVQEERKGPFSICFDTEKSEFLQEEYVTVSPMVEEDV